MTHSTPKAIFIGPEYLGLEFIRIVKRVKDWNFTIVETVSEFWDGLRTGNIDDDFQAVITADLLYDEEELESEFERMVASLSSNCFLSIIQYHPIKGSEIVEKTTVFSDMLSNSREKSIFYFIDTQRPNASIEKAINQYIGTQNTASSEILRRDNAIYQTKLYHLTKEAAEAENERPNQPGCCKCECRDSISNIPQEEQYRNYNININLNISFDQ